MKIMITALLVLLVANEGLTATATQALITACEDKTKVVKRVGSDVKIVGEKLGGYCQGFLQGVFEVLQSEGSICNKEDEPTPEYLVSVLRTYRKDNQVRAKGPAAGVVRDALLRAFPCEETKSAK